MIHPAVFLGVAILVSLCLIASLISKTITEWLWLTTKVRYIDIFVGQPIVWMILTSIAWACFYAKIT